VEPDRAPGRLFEAFLIGFGAPTGDPLAGMAFPGNLESDLGDAWEKGRAAFDANGVTIDDATFARHLGRVTRNQGDAPSLSGLALEDLYLACACLVKAPGAAQELRARHGTAIRAAIARIVPGADGADVEQQLLDGLLVGSGTAEPKICSYSGQAPIDHWLQVSAQRAALMWLRAGQAETRAHRAASAEPVIGNPHPEVAYLKARYRDDFEQALKDALGRVAERERVLLRLHLVKGISAENIGKMFGVSQPTAWRWLARAREALLDDVKAALQTRLGVSAGEMASLAGLVASGLDLSLSQLLRTR
jgi:RNA polymerase sigma-70 factor (ECF subfamily)